MVFSVIFYIFYQMLNEAFLGLRVAASESGMSHVGGSEAGVSAGVDPGKGAEIHGNIKRTAVVRATTAHFEPQSADFGNPLEFTGTAFARDVNPRGVVMKARRDPEPDECIHHGLLNPAHQRPDQKMTSSQIEKGVGDYLPGGVVRHFSAPV